MALSGYRHSAVQILSAAIAANRPTTISNAPIVADMTLMGLMVAEAGGKFLAQPSKGVLVDPTHVSRGAMNAVNAGAIHGSLYLFVGLATLIGYARLPDSGGCQIGHPLDGGKRPVSHIAEVMRTFGFSVSVDGFALEARRTSQPEDVTVDVATIVGSAFATEGPMTSGATKAAIICAIGCTSCVIRHPFLKTDTIDLLNYVELLGFDVRYCRLSIKITRPARISSSSIEFAVGDCVSEFVTFVALSVLHGKELAIHMRNLPATLHGLSAELDLLRKMGIVLKSTENTIHVAPPYDLRAVEIIVDNHGIRSDHAPFFALMLTEGNGPASITELVWRGRFGYVPELQRADAKMSVSGNTLSILPSPIRGTVGSWHGTDVRSTAVLVLAATCLDTPTSISGAEHVTRGYDNFPAKLRRLGFCVSDPVPIVSEREEI